MPEAAFREKSCPQVSVIPAAAPRVCALCLFALIALAVTASAGTIQALSKADPALLADSGGTGSLADLSCLSADGRYVAFISFAANLVPHYGDMNGSTDVFLHDRFTGKSVLVSHNSTSTELAGNGESGNPVISTDGRYVAFVSTATDLVPGQIDTNGTADVFLFDRITESTILISHSGVSSEITGNGVSGRPSISADDNLIAFSSSANDLIPGLTDSNFASDIFVFDRATGAKSLISHRSGAPTVAGNGDSFNPTISTDGSRIAFVSQASDLASGQVDFNGTVDVFLYSRASGTATLVSHGRTALNVASNGLSNNPVLSADGGSVAFTSNASDMVPGQIDGNRETDVFFYTASSGALELVSHSSASPITAGNARSFQPFISGNGNFIGFLSPATNLVTGQIDTNGAADVFLYDRAAGQTKLISHLSNSLASTDNTARFGSLSVTLSADGRFVAFDSDATGLTSGYSDTNAGYDAFLYEQASGSITLLSRATAIAAAGDNISERPILSADGGVVAVSSGASNLVTGLLDTNGNNDVFLYSRESDALSLVSLRASDLPSITAGGSSFTAPGSTMNASGRFVLFQSFAGNLVELNDANRLPDLFLRDRATGTTTLVSRSADSSTSTANAEVRDEVISANGRCAAFVSKATNLVSGQVDAPETDDVFLYDRITGTTTLVSHTAGLPTAAANSTSSKPSMSASGRYVVFTSFATDLVSGQVDANGGSDVFLFDRISGEVSIVSRSGSPTKTGNASSSHSSISADGRYIVYQSVATDLLPGSVDTNGDVDIFLFDRVEGTTTLISRAVGAPLRTGNAGSHSPVLATEGLGIAFLTHATDLVSGLIDDNSNQDIFLYDPLPGSMVLVSHAAGAPNVTANSGSESLKIDASGKRLAFLSYATNLIIGQKEGPPGWPQVMLFDATSGEMIMASHAANSGPGTPGNAPVLLEPAISADGEHVAFISFATDLVVGQIDSNNAPDVFLYERRSDTTALVSRSVSSPTATDPVSFFSSAPVINADGSCVAFTAYGDNLVKGDFNGQSDAFLYCSGSASE